MLRSQMSLRGLDEVIKNSPGFRDEPSICSLEINNAILELAFRITL
jgi:hypothetical protein